MILYCVHFKSSKLLLSIWTTRELAEAEVTHWDRDTVVIREWEADKL